MAYLNSMGITAWLDAGGRGMSATALRALPASRRPRRTQHPRVLDHDPPAGDARAGRQGARRNSAAEAVPGQRLLRSRRLGRIDLRADHDPTAAGGEQHQAGGPGAVAARHRTRSPSTAFISTRTWRWSAAIDAFLDLYEAINKEHPIKGLRWAFSHLDQVTRRPSSSA